MHENEHANDRRKFLRLGVTVAAGISVPPLVAGCNGGGDDGPPPFPPETFVQPLELVSQNGVLDVAMTLAYLDTTLPNPDDLGKRDSVSLRNMFGTIPAPTLRIRVGDLLRIKIVNNLPPNPPDPNPTRHLRYHNSTNLHTHGLHVYPDIYPQPATPPYIDPNVPNLPPLVFGDFVVDDPAYGIQPGQSRQYEYRIREDHPPGTYWYHPHLHGSSAIQVGSGMAGMLIIEGASDDVPEIDAATERCMVFQAPIYDKGTGTLEDFGVVSKITTDEPKFMINGVRRPRILMRSGEVQNWRFLNAGTFNMLNLSLQGHAFYQYSHDGNRRSTFKVVPPLPNAAFAPTNPTSYPEGVALAVGNRTDVLVKAGAPGTYLLRTFPIEMGRSGNVVAGDIVAEVVVEDAFFPMNLPREPLPVTSFLTPISDEELASHGGLKRTIVMRVIASTTPTPVPPDFVPFVGKYATPLVQPPPGEFNDWVYQAGPAQTRNKVYALGSAANTPSTDPGMPTTYIPFQSSKAVTQMVALNAVEEWTIVNFNNIRHPFHIHVNPMYVVAVNGERLAEPYWADTIPLPYNSNASPGNSYADPATVTSITFRMRFLHFTGRYVMHCHMLVHEDMGMMQGVTVV